MKIKELILTSALLLSVLPASAYVVVDETTTPEYLINQGYSTQTADLVQLEKAKIKNLAYKKISMKTFWRKVWVYVDFGVDDGSLLQHDIKPGYSVTDW